VNDAFLFKPPRRQGLILHAVALLLLLLASAWSLMRAFESTIGPGFLAYFLLALGAAALVPVVVYRAYALYKASYQIEQDGIRLSWGLRAEEIPMDEVVWVRSLEEINQASVQGDGLDQETGGQSSSAGSIPLPFMRWPGAVLGTRRLPDGGQIEFMASSPDRLVFIATPRSMYAISPADPADFRRKYQRYAEMGSLTPLAPRSIYPTFLVNRVWSELPARYLLLAGLALSLILLVWVSLVAPGYTQISLGFEPDGGLRGPVPAVQLLLLPLLNAFFYLTDLALGLFFYRRGDQQIPTIILPQGRVIPAGQALAYLLWSSGAATPLLFLIALVTILRVQ
jgi:hypothetical protein